MVTGNARFRNTWFRPCVVLDESYRQAIESKGDWWTWGGSNSRPHGCKPRFLICQILPEQAFCKQI